MKLSRIVTVILLLAFSMSLLAGEPAILPINVFLAGDAGENDRNQAPALAALRKAVEASESLRLVLYLGDNIYPAGLPPEKDPTRARAEEILRLQAEAGAAASKVIFIPGNHDWAYYEADGWNAIRRQAAFLATLGSNVTLAPLGGCPGPVVVEPRPNVRFVLLDTQWWLHAFEKPSKPSDGCPVFTDQGLETALQDALNAPAETITGVFTHHPIVSGGPHGGTFTWKDHIFPARNWKKWMWIPLPIIGSAYVASRAKALPVQDLASKRYSELRAMLQRVFARHPPLFIASGHDHNLQVIRPGPDWPYQLISGAGSPKKLTPSRAVEGTLYETSRSGLMVLSIAPDGATTVKVLVAEPGGNAREAYRLKLR